MHILVVEDQADLARHIVGALTRAGHTAVAVHDGLEALPHRRVTRKGERIELSPREFEVLQILMKEPGRIFPRNDTGAALVTHDPGFAAAGQC